MEILRRWIHSNIKKKTQFEVYVKWNPDIRKGAQATCSTKGEFVAPIVSKISQISREMMGKINSPRLYRVFRYYDSWVSSLITADS